MATADFDEPGGVCPEALFLVACFLFPHSGCERTVQGSEGRHFLAPCPSEGKAGGLGVLPPSLPLLSRFWLRVLVNGRPLPCCSLQPPQGTLVAMRVWVLDNDGPTSHGVGVIM